MGFLFVFAPLLVMTAVIAAFMTLTWPTTRSPGALAAFWGVAMVAHVAWAMAPHVGDFAPLARWLAITWLASMLAATTLLIPFALLAAWASSKKLHRLSRALPCIYSACFLLSGIILAVTSTADFRVREEDIRIAGLPAGLEGFRIANLGDVHIGRFIDTKELRRGIEAVNDRHVDVVAVTGDLLDDINQLEETMRVLELSNTPQRVIAILGNHEEMGELPRILSAYREHKSRITLLRNESVAVSRAGATLHFVGVDYPLNRKAGHLRPNPRQYEVMSDEADTAFAGLSSSDTIVALSHHPAFFPIAAAHGAALTLASHTHGGQLRIFDHPIINVHPYLQGFYREGNASLDVSTGFGHWLPIRFGVPREIVIVTLRGE